MGSAVVVVVVVGSAVVVVVVVGSAVVVVVGSCVVVGSPVVVKDTTTGTMSKSTLPALSKAMVVTNAAVSSGSRLALISILRILKAFTGVGKIYSSSALRVISLLINVTPLSLLNHNSNGILIGLI